MESKGQSLLENAYKLVTPEDNEEYYAAFAASYDDDFAAALGYRYPRAIAQIYHQSAGTRICRSRILVVAPGLSPKL